MLLGRNNDGPKQKNLLEIKLLQDLLAVESLRKWWVKMGFECYPDAKQLLIIADSGGSNSNRGRLWKSELQKFANEKKLQIKVCHLPPGTSKWNKIEHKLFCHITKNWRGRPLISYEVIVNLISHTTTKKGLKIRSELDLKTYLLLYERRRANRPTCLLYLFFYKLVPSLKPLVVGSSGWIVLIKVILYCTETAPQ